ncbi:unnamed protein product [Polarella glacialis]|uniref:Uncharacterized protein n=1 Tax=Polarella glacialis TaxID=89957 RepID=A0A813DK48_POLGL|nr:unnamed protein product [Polarella glacialis]CAE8615595.1 unnamed protein product [Polarella glacialis]
MIDSFLAKCARTLCALSFPGLIDSLQTVLELSVFCEFSLVFPRSCWLQGFPGVSPCFRGSPLFPLVFLAWCKCPAVLPCAPLCPDLERADEIACRSVTVKMPVGSDWLETVAHITRLQEFTPFVLHLVAPCTPDALSALRKG